MAGTAIGAPKNVLVVTVTKGFRHSSIPTAERVLAELAQKDGSFSVDYARTDADIARKMTPGALAGYVHGQITTLKTALVHPIVQNMPIDLRTALTLFRAVRAGLGVVNVNLQDTRRAENYLTLRDDPDGRQALVIRYAPAATEARVMPVRAEVSTGS